MSQKGFSIGRDVTLVAILPSGVPLRLGKVTNWTAKQETTDQRVKLLDGTTENLRYYDGWSGNWRMERAGPELDQYFANAEAGYYAGADEGPVTIQQTIKEPDGSVSQYRFERCLLKFDDPGDWGSDKTVSQTVSFMASRRIRQA